MKKGEFYRDAAGSLWLVVGSLPTWFVRGKRDCFLLLRKRTEFQRRLDVKVFDPSEGTLLTLVEESDDARNETIGYGPRKNRGDDS